MELISKTTLHWIRKKIFSYAETMSLTLAEPFRSFQNKMWMVTQIRLYFNKLCLWKIKKMGGNIENSRKQKKLAFNKKSF